MNWKEKVNKQLTFIIDVKSRYGNYSSFEKTFNDIYHYNNWCSYMTKRGNRIIGEELITKKLNEMKKQVIISNGIKPTYAEGGEVSGYYSSIHDFVERNNLEAEADKVFGEGWEADDDMEMIRELAGVNYDVGEIDYETERDHRDDDYIKVES
jgi:hypothetical protein